MGVQLRSSMKKQKAMDWMNPSLKDQMALRVKYVGEYGTHAAAKKAGFKKDDVIVLLDGKSTRLTEGEMIGDMLQNHLPGEQVKATVVRGSDRMEFLLPMQ